MWWPFDGDEVSVTSPIFLKLTDFSRINMILPFSLAPIHIWPNGLESAGQFQHSLESGV